MTKDRQNKKGRREFPLLPFFLLISLIVLFFSDIIFSGRTLSTSLLLPGTTLDGPYTTSKRDRVPPFTFDLSGNAWINEPTPYIIKKQISKGLFPSWNPDEGLGMPLLANPGTDVLNPLKTFLHINPTPFLHDMFYLLRLLLMGFFTHLFLRERGVSHLSSCFGATSFMLSGYSVWWINLHPLSSMMYIPGLFYFYERIVSAEKRNNGRNLIISSFFFSLFLAFSIFGGKPHVIIMGLILLFIYAFSRNISVNTLSLRQPFSAIPLRLIILIISGILLASILIFPFAELLKESSLIARQVRTGASSHTLPLISSITIWQPLFLGIKDYFYGSWLRWSPFYMVPYTGITILVLYIYGVMRKGVFLSLLPFYIFSLFLFLKIYGILPNDLLIGIPILGGTNFIKYHGMFFFSLSVISAHAVEDISEGGSSKFYPALILTSVVLVVYFLYLRDICPPEKTGYITKVLIACVGGLFITGLFFCLSQDRRFLSKRSFVYLLALLMIIELYIYLPKEHPERMYPYNPPPYLKLIGDPHPYRIIGDGNTIPPVISSAMGIHDLRGINVLLPNDYYLFFENLISFSVPYTNNPSPLVAATSPVSDLLGVRYILSREGLDISRLEDELRQHISGLRTVRYLNGFKSHGIKGSGGYGYFESGGERRFSLFFKSGFRFSAKVKITEPWLFVGATLIDKDDTMGTENIDIIIGRMRYRLNVDSRGWRDRWIDVSKFMGRTIEVVMESTSQGRAVAIGGFGLSKGREWERELLNSLYTRHLEEYKYLQYIGQHNGIHIYENRNVMPRAFILHEAKKINTLEDAISGLQEGHDFRRVVLVSEDALFKRPADDEHRETVRIKRYLPDLVEIDVDSKGGILILSDLYYPGWKVKVNGREERIIRVFGALRGVVVPQGRNEVVFQYRPLSLYTGMGISLFTLVVWLIFLLKKKIKEGEASLF